MHRSILIVTATLGGAASGALAGGPVVLDGQLDAAYGPALVVQNTQTQFGDSNNGVIDWANGSELDGAHALIADDVLYLFLAGNLESNYNKLEIFLDFQAGGQNTLRGDNPDVDFNGLNRMGDDGSGNGLTFDAAFSADGWIGLTCGDGGGGVFSTFANWAPIATDGGGVGEYLGSGGAGTSVLLGSNGINIAIDNSNVRGVDGGDGASDGSGVATGVELAIPMSLFSAKFAANDIKVCAFINGGGHDFMSNQVLAGLGGGPNLGDPRFVNLDLVGGDQFFTVSREVVKECPADIDGSGDVGFSDLVEVLANWGPCAGCPQDLDGNDDVGFSDLVTVLASWGPCP